MEVRRVFLILAEADEAASRLSVEMFGAMEWTVERLRGRKKMKKVYLL